MTRSSWRWRLAGAAFVFINVAGVIYAVAMEEWMHAGAHIALLLGGFAGWQLLVRSRREQLRGAQQDDEQLQSLQRSVDALALGVERIGESQRYIEKLRVEIEETSPPKRDQ